MQHHSPLHAYVDLYSLIFISEGHLLLGTCVCLFRERSHGQRFQSFLLIQTWRQVHLFHWTNYSSLLNVGNLHLSADNCHSKTHCTFLCSQSNSSWQQLIFLAVLFFLKPQQFALMFRVQWYTGDITVHASPHRGELLLWDCSVVLTFGALWW